MSIRVFPVILLVSTIAYSANETIDYGRDILPILAENCFECHGPDEEAREADLRLDTQEGAFADLVGAVAIAPGDPEGSELIYRIHTRDGDERMPPKDSNKSLTAAEKKLLETWIEEGANYDKHWAFQPPVKKPLPATTKHPVDAFVRDRLKKVSIEPSGQASPTTLVRRIFLDLIGLPPSPAEIESFLTSYRNNESTAVNALIDDLQQRPAFGEKWARHWLDVARYADTNGFEKDKLRDQWVYREWVIKAINEDMPYDQFLIEQLAGDLIPNRTQDQLIASGFMRNGMVNEEGAIIPEQFRLEGIFDRMDCFGKAVIGLTLQCAQCHSHKFDPISHDEYYGLFAFFNETSEAKSWIYSDDQADKIKDIRRQVVALEDSIRAMRPEWKKDLAAWETAQLKAKTGWTIWDTDIHEWVGGLNHPEELSDKSILILGHPTVSGEALIEGEIDLPMITGMRFEALRHKDQPFSGPGRSYWGTFAISEWEVFRQWPGETEWTPVEIAHASTDFATPVGKLNPYFNNDKSDPDNKRRIGPAKFLIDGDKTTAWQPDRGPILRHSESTAVFELKEPLAMPKGSRLKVSIHHNHGGSLNGRDNLQIGRFRLAVTDQVKPKAPPYDYAAELAMAKPGKDGSAEENETIFRAWRSSQNEFSEINEKIASLEKEYPEARTSVLHSADTDPGLERVTRLLSRGVWDQPEHAVERGTPAILNPLLSQNPTRLDLAYWATNEEAPLTTRVQVNRVWQAIFGDGLVPTPEDFGTRAPIPEYQDLLDWLAVDFREKGWSVKSLIRTILTSKTYQQSSNLTPELRELDPKNILLARGPRFRAEAEVVRDIALTASGLLNPEVGGPSIFPPVPETVLKDTYFIPEYWKEAQGQDRYRRSLYMFRKRAMPDPVLGSFDAPNADVSCTRRIRSNTPLSALTSLNEPIFVEASQALAQRILREGGDSDADRVNYAFLLTTGRAANKFETEEILNLIKSQRDRLAEGWLDVRKIAFKDPEQLPGLPEGITPRDVASWTIASRVLLNLDETLTKN